MAFAPDDPDMDLGDSTQEDLERMPLCSKEQLPEFKEVFEGMQQRKARAGKWDSMVYTTGDPYLGAVPFNRATVDLSR